MKINYQKMISEISGNEILYRINEDNSITFIPMNEENPEYQRYLNPEAEQSTPSVIDEAEAK
jgi:hypothetical protein